MLVLCLRAKFFLSVEECKAWEVAASRDEDILNTLASLARLGNNHIIYLPRTTLLEVKWIYYCFIVTSMLSHVNHVSLKEFPLFFPSLKIWAITKHKTTRSASSLFLPPPLSEIKYVTSNWCLLSSHKKQFLLYKGVPRASTWTYEHGFCTAKEVCVPFVHLMLPQICTSNIALIPY